LFAFYHIKRLLSIDIAVKIQKFRYKKLTQDYINGIILWIVEGQLVAITHVYTRESEVR